MLKDITTIARIRREHTGEERDIVERPKGFDGMRMENVEWWWTQGNGSCDCVRSGVFAKACGEAAPYPEQQLALNSDPDWPACSDGKFTLVSLQVIEPNGEVTELSVGMW